MAINPNESLNYSEQRSNTAETRTKSTAAEVLKEQHQEARPNIGAGEHRNGTMPTIILMNFLMIAAVLIGCIYLAFNGTSRHDSGAPHQEVSSGPEVQRTGQPSADVSVKQFGRRDPALPSETLESTNQNIRGGNSSNGPREQNPLNAGGAVPPMTSPTEGRSGL